MEGQEAVKTEVIADPAPANATAVKTAEPAPAGQEGANQTPAANESSNELGNKGREELVALRRRAQEAEKRSAYLEGQLAGAGVTKKPEATPVVNEAPKPPARPDAAQFASYEDYNKALQQYEDDREAYVINKAKWEVQQEGAAKAAKEHTEKMQADYAERLKKAEEKFPDLREVSEAFIDDPQVIKSPHLAVLILTSEQGPELMHYLGTHLDEARKISRMTSTQCAKEIGKLEVRLESQPPMTPVKKVSDAPPATKTLDGTGGSGEKDLNSLSMEEYHKARNAQRFGKG